MEYSDVFLSYARVVRQPADNSCLYHALSYSLADADMFENVYDRIDGFQLRSSINTYIRDNGNVMINLAPDVRTSITDAVLMEGYSCEAYSQLMSNKNLWGGVVEIGTVAKMFSVNVSIFVPVIFSRQFKWLGTFRCTKHDADTTNVYILYTGLNHYDSLINVVYKENYTPTEQEDDCSDLVLDAIDVMSTRLPCLATKMQNHDRDLKEGIRML
jgi:OTU-like cysteine protease